MKKKLKFLRHRDWFLIISLIFVLSFFTWRIYWGDSSLRLTSNNLVMADEGDDGGDGGDGGEGGEGADTGEGGCENHLRCGNGNCAPGFEDKCTCPVDCGYPNNSCAADTCIGSTCWNGCNNIPGTKDCSVTGACGNADLTCDSGTVGDNAAHGGGHNWYCNGSPNDAAHRSDLCTWRPSAQVYGACGSADLTCDSGTVGISAPHGGGHNWYCNGSPNDAAHRSDLCTWRPTCTPNCNDSGSYCSGTSYTGNCGQTCTGTKYCPPGCTPNCDDSGSYCSGTSYPGNCGQICTGTKYCPPGCTPNCDDAGNYCSGESYVGNCGQTCWGTKNCTLAPTLTLSASPNPVDYNTASTLYWTVSNATWCWGEPFPTVGWKTNSGSDEESTGNLTEATTYTMRCGNTGPGTVTKSVTVNVNLLPCACGPSVEACWPPSPLCNRGDASTVTESGGNFNWTCSNPAVCTGTASCHSPKGEPSIPPGNPACGSLSRCNATCGSGTQSRTCQYHECYSKTQYFSCNNQPCVPGYREVTPW